MLGYYEIMLIIHPDVDSEGQEVVLKELGEVIVKEGGSVSTTLDWHKRRLAYEINKLREGFYYLVYFSGQGTIIPELEHYFRVTDAVIRYMVVSIEETEFNAAAEKAAAAAEKASAEESAQKAEEAQEEVVQDDAVPVEPELAEEDTTETAATESEETAVEENKED